MYQANELVELSCMYWHRKWAFNWCILLYELLIYICQECLTEALRPWCIYNCVRLSTGSITKRNILTLVCSKTIFLSSYLGLRCVFIIKSATDFSIPLTPRFDRSDQPTRANHEKKNSGVGGNIMTSAADKKVKQVFVFSQLPLAARVATRRPGAPPGSLGYTLSPSSAGAVSTLWQCTFHSDLTPDRPWQWGGVAWEPQRLQQASFQLWFLTYLAW